MRILIKKISFRWIHRCLLANKFSRILKLLTNYPRNRVKTIAKISRNTAKNMPMAMKMNTPKMEQTIKTKTIIYNKIRIKVKILIRITIPSKTLVSKIIYMIITNCTLMITMISNIMVLSIPISKMVISMAKKLIIWTRIYKLWIIGLSRIKSLSLILIIKGKKLKNSKLSKIPNNYLLFKRREKSTILFLITIKRIKRINTMNLTNSSIFNHHKKSHRTSSPSNLTPRTLVKPNLRDWIWTIIIDLPYKKSLYLR